MPHVFSFVPFLSFANSFQLMTSQSIGPVSGSHPLLATMVHLVAFMTFLIAIRSFKLLLVVIAFLRDELPLQSATLRRLAEH